MRPSASVEPEPISCQPDAVLASSVALTPEAGLPVPVSSMWVVMWLRSPFPSAMFISWLSEGLVSINAQGFTPGMGLVVHRVLQPQQRNLAQLLGYFKQFS